MKNLLVCLVVTCLVLACGGASVGPPLGDFPAMTKKETDTSFTLVAPTSKSPASFKFTSSNSSVATIEGAVVTIKGPGETIITASQDEIGSFGPTQKASTLTVAAVPCETGHVRMAGVCTSIPTCINPATLVDNKCVAPASNGTFVSANGLTWMPVTAVDNWENSRAFCTGTVIGNATGWRLPTDVELAELYASGLMAAHGWALGNTWAATMGSTAQVASHVAINLSTGASSERGDATGAYVSCVK